MHQLITSTCASGVTQGSIIGPLLFIIYMIGLCNVSLSASSKLILYSDDILPFHPINSISDFSHFQMTLINCITAWLTSQIKTHAYFL